MIMVLVLILVKIFLIYLLVKIFKNILLVFKIEKKIY